MRVAPFLGFRGRFEQLVLRGLCGATACTVLRKNGLAHRLLSLEVSVGLSFPLHLVFVYLSLVAEGPRVRCRILILIFLSRFNRKLAEVQVFTLGCTLASIVRNTSSERSGPVNLKQKHRKHINRLSAVCA